MDVLRSGRWTVSGPFVGRKSYEQRFSEAFAAFNGVPFCVATASGSAALAVAFEALRIGYGDEVLVPGLTWVACASAVTAVGAVPILVDVDPETLCMSPAAARLAMSSRTTGILLVHSFCTVADLPAFLQLSKETDTALVEDCSQAHGATWNGRRVGTFAQLGVFSMQQSKILTSGEGGAVITRSPELDDRLQQLRADGRRRRESPQLGELDLEEVGAVQGHNHCLSEFHSAILLDRLSHLDRENEHRSRNADELSRRLLSTGLATPLSKGPSNARPSYYQYCVRLRPEAFDGCPIELVAAALSAELRLSVKPVYLPLNRSPLFNPAKSARLSPDWHRHYRREDFDLPEAERARAECLAFPHHALLGHSSDMCDLAGALVKVADSAQHLKSRHRSSPAGSRS